jgi:hypothetical protein
MPLRMVNFFLVFIIGFYASTQLQLILLKMYLRTGAISNPFSSVLFFVLNSVFKIGLNLNIKCLLIVVLDGTH